ncbi:MAG: 5'-methylthioadenosine/adenosylhomocysteine nucleosidase [Bacteroidota bacterium]
MQKRRKIGLIGAMPQELQAVVDLIEEVKEIEMGSRIYYEGKIKDQEVVAVFSRSGKVAAAISVCNLILHFEVDEVIFIGVAGGVKRDLKVGDVVIADRLIQHDVDARPVMPQYEIPFLGVTYFQSDKGRSERAFSAARNFLEEGLPADLKDRFNIHSPRVIYGDIASGDQFFAAEADVLALGEALPSVACVEMEGAAVAQACYEYDIPFTVIRTISDGADEDAGVNFQDFADNVANLYGAAIIEAML